MSHARCISCRRGRAPLPERLPRDHQYQSVLADVPQQRSRSSGYIAPIATTEPNRTNSQGAGTLAIRPARAAGRFPRRPRSHPRRKEYLSLFFSSSLMMNLICFHQTRRRGEALARERRAFGGGDRRVSRIRESGLLPAPVQAIDRPHIGSLSTDVQTDGNRCRQRR